MNKKNYLATIVFDPRGSDGTSDEMIPKLSEVISDSDGEVIKVENQGNHDFAYPQKKGLSNATYLQFEITGLPSTPETIKQKLKLEKINDKTSLVLDSIKELDNYKYLNINLLKKSLFTLINNISNSKGIKKDISLIDNTKDLLNYIERKIIWT
mgnify:CR=1 FL=1